MDTKKQNILLLVIFIVSFALLFYGQKHIGYMGLTLEFIGLIGLVTILYIYNKRYK
ncbi:DUF6903 family protein [Candidatus Stoquefichus massiliensis]|uniref:DUF6903 family protein n=1 Tax=Candidatus Stoquefichus massiliensis TaxID=1470350 RepID=UPI0004B458E3|nr:hypothetical protein [Candidatus Stoquefichus massiliensis]